MDVGRISVMDGMGGEDMVRLLPKTLVGVEGRNKVASPRGRDSIPVLCAVSAVPILSGATSVKSVA